MVPLVLEGVVPDKRVEGIFSAIEARNLVTGRK
jgi:hypothetical protein